MVDAHNEMTMKSEERMGKFPINVVDGPEVKWKDQGAENTMQCAVFSLRKRENKKWFL